MSDWIVCEGEVMTWPENPADMPPADTCGTDWCAFEATDAVDAARQAQMYDRGVHPDQLGRTAWCALYRALHADD